MVLAAGGYPAEYRKGDTITGLSAAAKLPGKIFHAGTQLNDQGEVLTSGGRVLCATALGSSVTAAQQQAYQLVEQVNWPDMYFRPDIAHRAVRREQGK